MAGKQPRKLGRWFRRGSIAVYAGDAAQKTEARQEGRQVEFREPEPPRAPTPLDAQFMRARGDMRGLTSLLTYYNPVAPDEAAQVRRAAALALPELRDPRIISILSGALYDNSSIVRAAAAEGLGKLSASIPVTGRVVSASGLSHSDRTRILSVLFPLLRKERVEDVRAAAAEAVYRAGGRAVLRPLVALVREGSVPFQRWFVFWAARMQQDELMIDLYPWSPPEIRDLIVNRLCSRMSPAVQAKLSRFKNSGDKDREELLQRVIGNEKFITTP